jgi:hypothetical protein
MPSVICRISKPNISIIFAMSQQAVSSIFNQCPDQSVEIYFLRKIIFGSAYTPL